jgi:putative hydrolase of the HAD superfamily
LGRTKPDPKGYRMAVSQMGLTLPEVAFVGHDAAELDGARSVGMPTVALSSSPDAAADVRLDRFEQLADVVSLQRPLAAAG